MTPVSRRTATWSAALTTGLLLSGCVSANDLGVSAKCGSTGEVTNSTLVTMAQSVPTATLIPCIRLVPAGWSLGNIDIRRGKSMFRLASDTSGARALTVVLSASCDVHGATPVPSDEAAARRYERPERITSGYLGERYYVY